MAVAARLVWRPAGFAAAAMPLTLFAVQLVLNIAWSWIFFGLHQPGWAFAVIILLLLAIAATTAALFRSSPVAGSMMLPYLAWVSFAAVLNFTIWRLNPGWKASSPVTHQALTSASYNNWSHFAMTSIDTTPKVITMNMQRCSLVITQSILLALAWAAASVSAADKPVKVYILSGQSNMVGIGQVTGGGSRWGAEFIDPILSVYPGKYDAKTDYEKLDPVKTLKLESFGGTNPTPYSGGGSQIVRGAIQITTTGVYEFRPGYGESTHNIMEVDGKEVHRREPGKDAVYTHLKLTAGKKVPFKITYLTEQANGLGWLARMDIPGTLATVVKHDGKFPYLVDKKGSWVQREDVWYKGVVTATANKWLSVGCGASDSSIGPELGFGHTVGEHHEEPVLVLKASQGNRSLGWDYLPPGNQQFEQDGFVYAGYKDSPAKWEKGSKPQPINWYAGKQYDDCFGEVHRVLKNFDKEFPQWKGRGYEIAGFVWWQGHKDGGEPYASRYEQNLVHLIKALRKEFAAPQAPFVIATIGFDGWKLAGPHKIVAEAQLAVSGDKGKYPEFMGNVLTVESRDFWREADVSPKNQGYHYNQNAETYMLVGEALGKGMLELLKQEKK